jgi:hypothetical protein
VNVILQLSIIPLVSIYFRFRSRHLVLMELKGKKRTECIRELQSEIDIYRGYRDDGHINTYFIDVIPTPK